MVYSLNPYSVKQTFICSTRNGPILMKNNGDNVKYWDFDLYVASIFWLFRKPQKNYYFFFPVESEKKLTFVEYILCTTILISKCTWTNVFKTLR